MTAEKSAPRDVGISPCGTLVLNDMVEMLKKIDAKPRDVFVLRVPETFDIDLESFIFVKEHVETLLNGARVIILPASVTLTKQNAPLEERRGDRHGDIIDPSGVSIDLTFAEWPVRSISDKCMDKHEKLWKSFKDDILSSFRVTKLDDLDVAGAAEACPQQEKQAINPERKINFREFL